MLKGNKGEWCELYTFLKVLTDGRIYAADANYNKLENVFLQVLSIIREEVHGFVYRYHTGETIVIKLNGEEIDQIPCSEFETRMYDIWNRISNTREATSFNVPNVNDFLCKVHISKLKSPARKTSDYFGGTIDIMLETRNNDNVVREMGFSCKSEISAGATLFNASGDNTNFVFEVKGAIDDEVMQKFNGLYREVQRKGQIEYDVATHDRMKYLKSIGAELVFSHTAKKLANDNLVRCGGKEMPAIVAGMVKHFYFDNFGGYTSVLDCVRSLAKNDVAQYEFDDLEDTYYTKVATFLYNSFTGMRLGTHWNGRTEVNGGYIVVKHNGDVVAYHSTIADEFKDFLMNRLTMEGPSHKRHKDMIIEKVDDKYFLKLALQLRFGLSSRNKMTQEK